MIIKETVKANVSLKAHPIGLKAIINNEVSKLENFKKISGAKNVLVIGGSSGYGLASRLICASNLGATTINVSLENEPNKKKTGTAGYWNNKYFNEHFENQYDLNADAFSNDTKEEVIKLINKLGVKIDLVIYSIASPVRNGVHSSIKPIENNVVGKTIDIASLTVKDIVIEKATAEEIENTVYVMGGQDWYEWIKQLSKNNCLTTNCKTFSYTYIGGVCTADIYRNGTIGMAKVDLENTANKLSTDFNIDAFIVSSKAICSKASVFIPRMPIYAGCLYEVMTKHNIHESTLEHIYRLFNDMIYGDNKTLDELGRYRLDALEIDQKIQDETINLMETLTDEELFNLNGMKEFIEEFYQINGFRVLGVNYEEEVEL